MEEENYLNVVYSMRSGGKGRIILALLSVYIVWGSTYLAIRIALEGLPPFLMAGTRFIVSGSLLYIYMRMRGAPAPERAQWKGAAQVGMLLLVGGNGGVVFAEQWVASGLTALGVATVPLWAVLFAGLGKQWPGRLEWLGLVIGFAGIVFLNLEGDLRASPAGAFALIVAAVSWAFGSVWSRHVTLPQGLMASATEMLAGGVLLIAAGLITGERITAFPGWRSVGALVYLIAFGSLVGFSSYVYLLGKVRPALATSYAYVNPVIAVMLGAGLAGEKITGVGVIAMATIIAGVALVVLGHRSAHEQ